MDGVEEEEIRGGDPVLGAVAPCQGVGKAPVGQSNAGVPDLGGSGGRSVVPLPNGGLELSALDVALRGHPIL